MPAEAFAGKDALMSKSSHRDLELQIQLSLVARVRQAAHLYRSAPAENAALQSYVSALECLAEYVATKCQETQPVSEIPATPRLRGRQQLALTPKPPRAEGRVIPFPSSAGAPLPAA
jgi:hypothetical protein